MLRYVFDLSPWLALVIAAWSFPSPGGEPPGEAKVDAAIGQFEARFQTAPWGYGWTHGVDKVFRKDRPFHGRIGGTLQVELAANEYEGLQLVLRGRKSAKNVRVRVSDLKADGGRENPASVIPSREVQVLTVGYVNTKKPPYPVEYVGWWPDPLLDFLPQFDLDAGVWQPVWLDVHAPASQARGYTGERLR